MGYNTAALAGKAYNATGPCFAACGTDGTFTLASVVPTAFDWESDYIYIINPDDCSADAALIYLDANTASAYNMQAGWYDSESLQDYTNVEWDLGTGFMTSFGSGTPNFVYSGEVFTDPMSIDCKGKAYVMVPNPLPRTVTLSEVSATGFDWESDYLYVINPEDCSADAALIYLDANTASAYNMQAGWYDSESLDSYADYEVLPGLGFQSSFGSGNVILNFPSIN